MSSRLDTHPVCAASAETISAGHNPESLSSNMHPASAASADTTSEDAALLECVVPEHGDRAPREHSPMKIRKSMRIKTHSVPSSGNNCAIFCLQMATSVPAKYNLRSAQLARLQSQIKLGTRLNFDQVAKIATDSFGLGGIVTAGFPSERSFLLWPRRLHSNMQVVVLMVKKHHCSLFAELARNSTLSEATSWLRANEYKNRECGDVHFC